MFPSLKEFFLEIKGKKVLFVGLGNEMRGDDGAGLYFVEKIAELNRNNWRVLKVGVSLENWLGRIISSDSSLIVLVDSSYFGGKVGEMKLLDLKKITAPGFTHNFSFPMVIHMMEESGKEVKFLGIQPKRTKLGEELSSEVKGSIEKFFLWLKNA
ncbi:hydrogenase maturation protease [Candidatus Calescamantes bacterium]|nr:hydrogenase maturation protease [Candidatus Calescamantes bacterium]